MVTCVLTSNAACASTSTVTSNSVTITITPASAPTISINTPSTSICSGQMVSFTSSITNGGNAPTYQWKVNGNNAGTGSTFSSVLNNNDVVTCVLTSNATCATTPTATSNSITITIGGTVSPAITISADNTTVCPGATVHFTATAANGGSSPTYQWKINGTNAGTGGSTFATVLNNGDVVTCVLTSNSGCVSTTTATSNSVTITTSGSVTPLVSISADNTSICVGGTANFTATPVNGGNTPTYQWRVNGANAGTGSTFSSSFSNGDVVTCVMTSSSACASVPTATSNSVTISVHAAPTVTVVPSGNVSVCANDSVQLTANGGSTFVWSNSSTGSSIWVSQQGSYSVTASEFGCSATANPVNVSVTAGPTASITQNGNTLIASAGSSFQWYLNGGQLANATGQAYVATQTGNYSVKVTDANCCSNLSSEVNVVVSGIDEVNSFADVKLYPVPNTGSFVVETSQPENVQLSVTDMYGRLVFFKREISTKENVTIENLAAQIYFVTLRSDNKMKVMKMEVK